MWREAKVIVFMIVIWVGAPVSSRSEDLSFQVALKGGKKAAAERQFAKADAIFELAVKAAAGQNSLLAEVYLERALNLRAWKESNGGVPDDLPTRLETAYQDVIGHTKGADRELARNNLAVLQWDTGRADTALKTFGETPFTGPQAHVYSSNHAFLLEKKGSVSEAFEAYFMALKRQPSYARAAEGAERMLFHASFPDESRRARAEKLVETILPPPPRPINGLPQRRPINSHAGVVVRRCLEKWRESPESFMPHLITYYARLPVDAELFRHREWPALQALKLTNRPGAQLEELRRIYQDPRFPESRDEMIMHPER